MTSNELREKFLSFFEQRGHKRVPSSSLLPNDPSVLLTTAGMQQFKPYYTGDADPIKDFGSKNTVSIQKSFRTSDIDEVGDESHLTFFEMLGNFSFGGYFKKEAIEYAYEFIVKELGLKVDYVSVFGGDANVPADDESEKIWKSIDLNLRVEKAGREDNFWGPTGNQGPCGPTTEIYVKNVQGKSIEIWNIVFNEYFQHKDKRLEKLQTPGVDTGMGLERLAMVVQNKPTIFETDLFETLFNALPNLLSLREKRKSADHLRAFVFLFSDGIRPSSKDDRGSILIRLLRDVLDFRLKEQEINNVVKKIIEIYGVVYSELLENKDEVLSTLKNQFVKSEAIAFSLPKDPIITYKLSNIRSSAIITSDPRYEQEYEKLKAEKKFNELIELVNKLKDEKKLQAIKVETKKPGQPVRAQSITLDELQKMRKISGEEAFEIYQRTGARIGIISEIAKTFDLEVDTEGFEKAFEKHRDISRAGVEKKFGGHGLIMDTGELKAGNEQELQKVTRFHTATHLLNQALHDVLGDEVEQRGSDITPERTRFDFVFSRKVTKEELQKIEDIVNEKIKANLPIQKEVMPLDKALAGGARAFFKLKYPPEVSVYSIGSGEAYSKELCGGPHVLRTSEIGKFKITKEESSSAGIRRIRAIIEP